MAGEASKMELRCILLHAMLTQKNLKTQCDRLLELRRRLQQQLSPSDDSIAARLRELALDVEDMNLALADGIHDIAAMRMDYVVALKNIELATDIFKAYSIDIKAGARAMATCLELAAESGTRLALNSDFAAMTEEELFDALVAQRLPARPTTQAEAFSRVEAAFYAVKLSPPALHACMDHLTDKDKRPSSIISEP
jgi:hypothetical protein